MSGRGGTEWILGRLHPGPGCNNSLFLDADRNVLSHPSILLVVLLNVSLNTLPVLALRVSYQAFKKKHPKVRVAGVPIAHSQSPSWEQRSKDVWSWGWEIGDPYTHPVPSGGAQ